MKLVCFGDSNTWGYDPCAPLGDRYGYSIRWTALLGADVVNAGQNGRMIPRLDWETAEAADLLRAAPDVFLVMLGSNDLLCGASAEEAAGRMERFLTALPPAPEGTRRLLVAPPPLRPGEWVQEPETVEASHRYAACLRALAARLGWAFADAGDWAVETAFDGIHFTPAGHAAFAAGLRRVLERLTTRSD